MSHALPAQQHVWAWPGKGEPENLQYEMRPLPFAGPGEVVIANHAIGLNPVDWKMIEWGHEAWTPGHVPGVDGMGTIVAIGSGVRLPLGLRVAFHQSLSRNGSFAEYASVDARGVIPVPAGVADAVAAALPCPGLTALQAWQKVPAQPDWDILVTGAGGAVGLILAQLAVRAGCRVWVTASLVHRDDLLALGVCDTFDYHDRSWHDQLAAALGPRRIRAAFDTVSGAHARSLAPSLGYNGHLVCIQDRIEQNPLPAFTSAISLHEVALNSFHRLATDEDWRDWRAAGAALFGMVEAGLLHLPSIETYPLDALPIALASLKSGARKGKLVVMP